VDTDETCIRNIRSAFESEGFSVDVYTNGDSARSAIASIAFDLVLLERDLPDGDGLEICRELTAGAQADGIPIIIVTRRAEESDRIDGFRAGADDYMTKPANPRELLARARAVMRRAGSHRGATYDARSLQIFLDAMKIVRDGISIPLSLGETEVLGILMRHAPAAVAVIRILLELRSSGRDVTRSTVEARLKSLRRKLGSEAIESRPGLGYAFRGGI